ncbi:hypothetical protein YC2023_124418 [Brassica napus]
MAIFFVSPKSSRKTPPMKGLELQCSPLKPPFKILTDLPYLPSALYLDPYLYPYLSYLRSYPYLSYLRSLARYPNHGKRKWPLYKTIHNIPRRRLRLILF